MSVEASGLDLPPALRSSRSPLPSEAPIRDVQFGDFANDEIATSQGPAVVLKTELNYNSANSIDFADQRICSAPFTPTRRRSAKSDMGHGSRATPPYKARSTSQSPSATSPRSPKKNARDSQSEVASVLPAGAAHRPEVPSIGMDSKEQRPVWWNEKARAFYRIGECADQRNRSGKAPQLDEHARLAIARTQLAATEMQLRVESRRFEVAQMQLQVQAERTATAKAQLAVEKARNQGRRLDIELEQQQTAAAAAKTGLRRLCSG